MPITQREMMAIISAGLAFKQAYHNVQRLAQQADADPDLRLNPTWTSFYQSAMQPFMTAAQDDALLQIQFTKYRARWNLNDRKARQMRRKRARLNPSAQPAYQLPTIEEMRSNTPETTPTLVSFPPLPAQPQPYIPPPITHTEDDEAYLEEFNKASPPPLKPI